MDKNTGLTSFMSEVSSAREKLSDAKRLETIVMAHRYLYYISCAPVLQDHEYDVIERRARAVLPQSSPVQRVGSDLIGTYSNDHIEMAARIKYLTQGKH